ncbi:MAG: hypothetical protein ACM31C_07330 [Acidobacteriota bacterium]
MRGEKRRFRPWHLLVGALLVGGAAASPALAAPTSATERPRPASVSEPAAPPPHMHDHTPRHGGIVGMSGSYHLEAVALPQGIVRVYVSDLERKPLPLDGARGKATITCKGVRTQLDLVVRDGALEARTTPFHDPSVDVRIEAVVTNQPLLIDFTLPVGGAPGSSGEPVRQAR